MTKTKFVDALVSINKIMDFGCDHHLIGDQSKFSSLQEYNGNNVIVTVDNTVHHMENEGIVVISGK